MMEGSIEFKLGEAITMLKGINTRMDRADESRAKIYERLDDMAQRETRIEGEVKSLGDRVVSIEKKVNEQATITEEVKTARDRVIFAGTVGKVLWSIGKGLLAAAAGAAAVYYQMTGKPPP